MVSRGVDTALSDLTLPVTRYHRVQVTFARDHSDLLHHNLTRVDLVITFKGFVIEYLVILNDSNNQNVFKIIRRMIESYDQEMIIS